MFTPKKHLSVTYVFDIIVDKVMRFLFKILSQSKQKKNYCYQLVEVNFKRYLWTLP